VVSNGIRNVNDLPGEQPSSLSREIKSNGVEIYTVAVGSDIDVMELIMMSSTPDNVFSIRYLNSKKEVRSLVKDKCQGMCCAFSLEWR